MVECAHHQSIGLFGKVTCENKSNAKWLLTLSQAVFGEWNGMFNQYNRNQSNGCKLRHAYESFSLVFFNSGNWLWKDHKMDHNVRQTSLVKSCVSLLPWSNYGYFKIVTMLLSIYGFMEESKHSLFDLLICPDCSPFEFCSVTFLTLYN